MRQKLNIVAKVLAWLSTIGLVVGLQSLPAYAALSSSSVALSDARISQTSQYTVTTTGLTTGQTIGCIELDLGTSADGSGSPGGLSTASSTFVSQSFTATGTWAVDNTQSASFKLRFTNATPVAPQSGSQTAVWGAVTNGSTPNTTYYGVLETYTTNACSTPVDTVTLSLVYTNGQAVSLTVNPALTFSLAGVASGQTACNDTTASTTTATSTDGTVPFGTITTAANGYARHNITVSTNAGGGYTVYIRYSGAPSNGTHTFTDWTGVNSAPTTFPTAGTTEAFGYNTNDTTLGTGTAGRFSDAKYAKFTTSNLEVAYDAGAVSNQATCVGYGVGISGVTPSGVYNGSTVILTATPTY